MKRIVGMIKISAVSLGDKELMRMKRILEFSRLANSNE